MNIQRQNLHANSKFLPALFLLIFYWFYMSICCGYSLSKFFLNFFDRINKADPVKSIQFRKKFNLKNILKNTIKIIIDFFWKIFKNWCLRIYYKARLVQFTGNRLIKTLKLCSETFQSIFKFKDNFQILKLVLPIFWETILVGWSLWNELTFFPIVAWVQQLRTFVLLLMEESLFITQIVYLFYLILLGIWGLIIGFLFGIREREEDTNLFLLLFLLQIIYIYGFNDFLLEHPIDLSREMTKANSRYKFQPQALEPVEPRPFKIIFEEPEKIPLPFLTIKDPLFIETEIFYEEPINFRFQLFHFYQSINEKIKH